MGFIRREEKEMTTDINYDKQKQFRSASNLTKWVCWLYVILAIVSAIAIASGYAQAELLNRAISGEVITWSEATANDTRVSLVGMAQFVLFFPSFIVFLIWIYRTHKNLPYLHAEGLRFTPGWSVGWFFVPIMNLFRPYQVVSETWKASNPEIDMSDSVSWQKSASSPIVGWWWAFFLISSFVAQIAVRIAFSGEELSDFLATTYAYMVSDAVDIVWIIITIFLVRGISQFQETKYGLISSS